MKSSLVFLAALALICPARSQTATQSSLRDLVAGKVAPLMLRAKDLNAEYALLRCSGLAASDAALLIKQASQGPFTQPVYYTQGNTVQLENGTYLLAYALDETVTPTATPEEEFEDAAPIKVQDRKLRPKDQLLLCLLDVNTLGNLTELKPFEAETHMESEAERHRAVAQTLQSLAQALDSYGYETTGAVDGIARWPRWTSIATPELRQSLHEHIAMHLWEHPSTGEAFGLNPALSNQGIYSGNDNPRIYLAYERTPSADGTRAVLFVNGHVERVAPGRWERLFKAAPALVKPTVPIVTTEVAARQKTVLLSGAAALYYMYKKKRDAHNRPTNAQYYLSKNGRIYYRAPRNPGQVIWVTPPRQGFRIPANEALEYKGMQGYNGSNTGRDLKGLVPR
jgi:hypothetical protein